VPPSLLYSVTYFSCHPFAQLTNILYIPAHNAVLLSPPASCSSCSFSSPKPVRSHTIALKTPTATPTPTPTPHPTACVGAAPTTIASVCPTLPDANVPIPISPLPGAGPELIERKCNVIVLGTHVLDVLLIHVSTHWVVVYSDWMPHSRLCVVDDGELVVIVDAAGTVETVLSGRAPWSSLHISSAPSGLRYADVRAYSRTFISMIKVSAGACEVGAHAAWAGSAVDASSAEAACCSMTPETRVKRRSTEAVNSRIAMVSNCCYIATKLTLSSGRTTVGCRCQRRRVSRPR
jgi:hypothetical protein